MQAKIWIKALRLALLLVFALSTPFPCILQAQTWYRLGLDEGGVGEDLQLLRLSDNSLGDVVWSANMEGGLFRATWSNGSWAGGLASLSAGRRMRR